MSQEVEQIRACYLIGTTSLLINCAEYLLEKQFKLVCVCTYDQQVISWANNNNIPVITDFTEFCNLARNDEVDYLFSIVNFDIIPTDVLQNFEVAAINYHDAKLTKYRGSNAVSWAIFNRELDHGITWHIIEQKVDAGCPLVEIGILLDKAETAETLEIKTFESAIAGFKSLVGMLPNIDHKQKNTINLGPYYSKLKLPPQDGFVLSDHSLEQNLALLRGLDFGVANNYYDVPKICINQKIYFILEYAIKGAGQINNMPNKYVSYLKLEKATIYLVKLKDLSGNIIDKLDVNSAEIIAEIPDRSLVQSYENIWNIAKRHESFWQKQLKFGNGLEYIEPLILKPEEYIVEKIIFENRSVQKIAEYYKDFDAMHLCMSFCALVYKVMIGGDSLYIGLSNGQKNLEPFYASFGVIFDVIDKNSTFVNNMRNLTMKVAQAANMNSPLEGFFERHHFDMQNINLYISLNYTLKNSWDFPSKGVCISAGQTSGSFNICAKDVHLPWFKSFIYTLPKLFNKFASNLQSGVQHLTTEYNSYVTQDQIINKHYKARQEKRNTFTINFKHIAHAFAVKIAAHNNKNSLTYSDLNCLSDKFAVYLTRNLDVTPNCRVAVMSQKSNDYIIAILGCMKAGVTFVPISYRTPSNRVRSIISAADCKLLIVDNLTQAYDYSIPVEDLSKQNYLSVSASESSNAQFDVGENTVAYIMFTSGSSGEPKGVMVTHRNLYGFLNAIQQNLKISQHDSWLSITDISFDISLLECLLPLIHGATLIVVPTFLYEDIDNTISIIKKYKPSIMQTTPSIWNVLLDHLIDGEHKFSQILCGGEEISCSLAEKLVLIANKLWNCYGPTETTIWSSICVLNSAEYQRTPAIGRPLDNNKFYIVDAKNQTLEPGVIGEIVISGEAVSKGYLSPDENKFVQMFDQRVYKTGDLGFYDENGVCYYLGRNDSQLKVNGHRIEVAELNHIAKSQPNIKSAYIYVHKENLKSRVFLLVILVKEYPEAISEIYQSINYQLSQPIPVTIVPILTPPLNVSGKVSQRILNSLVAEYIRQNSVRLPVINNDKHNTLRLIFKKMFKIDVPEDLNLISLGLTSLDLVKILSEINAAFNVNISLIDIYRDPTITNIMQTIADYRIKNSVSQIKNETEYDLTPIQNGIYFQSIKHSSGLYNIPILIKLHKDVEIKRLIEAVIIASKSFILLQSKLVLNDKKLKWTVATETQNIQIKILKLLEVNTEDYYVDYARQIGFKDFDLHDSLLWQAEVWSCPVNNYLFLNFHHIIADAYSISRFIDEIGKAYNLEYTYKTAIESTGDNYSINIDNKFWSKYLADFPEFLDLDVVKKKTMKLDRSNTADEVITVAIPEHVVQQILDFSQAEHITPYNVFVTSMAITLSSLCQQSKVLVGMPVSPRSKYEAMDSFAPLLNVLPFIISLNQESFRDLCGLSKEITTNLMLNSDVELQNLIKNFQLPLTKKLFPYQVVLNYENVADFDLILNGFKCEHIPVLKNICKFDLMFTFRKTGESFDLLCQYDVASYGDEGIKSLISFYLHILNRCLNNPDLSSKLISTPSTECVDIYNRINNTEENYDFDLDIESLFKDQLRKWPNKQAVIDKNISFTYAELDVIAEKVKNGLKMLDVCLGDRIIIFGDKSVQFVAAMLGVIKCSATYIPQDLLQVKDALKAVAHNSNAKIIINLSNSVLDYFDNHCKVVEFSDLIATELKVDFETAITQPDDLIANIIFTSGTTNEPKGVIISHRAVALLVKAKGFLKIESEDVIVNCSSISFDASTYDVWGTLLNGASLYLCDRYEVIDLTAFKLICEIYKPTLGFLSTGLFDKLVSLDVDLFRHFSRLLVGGEVMSPTSIKQFYSHFSENYPRLYNIYGPTEATVFTSAYAVTADDLNLNSIPIGKPIPFTRCYVLDNQKRLCQTNVKGELYIAGDRLAEGYLSESQTNAKFSEIEILGETERVYSTGDIVILDKNGDIVFVGRNDRQIKRNGFRIELDYIEKTIQLMPNINKAIVIPGQNKHKLYLFVTAHTVSEDDLFIYIKDKLPEFMWPSKIYIIDDFPLTKNGKFDTKLLQDKYLSQGDDVDKHLPITFDEPQLYSFAKVWQKILGVELGSVEDDYFQLGGDSIGCLLIISKSRDFGLFLEPIDFYEGRKLGVIFGKGKAKTRLVKNHTNKVEFANLAPIQDWFVKTFNGDINHFNQTRSLKLNNHIDLALLQKAVQSTFSQHQEFKLQFIKNDNKWQQRINNVKSNFKLNLLVLNSLQDLEAEISVLQTSLDIQAGDLHKIILAQVQSVNYLIIIIHHLIVDTVSWRILLQELEDSYDDHQKGEGLLYNDDYSSPYLNWAAKFTKSDPDKRVPELANNVKFPPNENCIQREISFDIKELLTTLEKYVEFSIYDVILSVFINVYSNLINKNRVELILETHGRDIVSFADVDITNTIGWFTFLFGSSFAKQELVDAHCFVKFKNEYESAKNAAKEEFLKNSVFKLGDTTKKVCFNFHGRSTIDYKLFSVMPNFTKTDLNQQHQFIYELEVNSSIFDNCLALNIISLPDTGFDVAEFSMLFKSSLLSVQTLLEKSVIEKTAVPDSFKLTPLQQTYWFGKLGVYEYGNTAPHLHLAYKTHSFDLKKFVVAINQTLSLHGMLRVKILNEELQVIRPKLRYEISTGYYDYDPNNYLNSATFANLRDEIFNCFSKNEAQYLFYIHVTRCNSDVWYIHFVVDLMLTDIIGLVQWFKDIETIYFGKSVAKLNINFNEYYNAVNNKAQHIYQQDREYWANLLSDLPETPKLPLVKHNENYRRLKRFSKKLDITTTNNLNKLANKLGVTLTSVFGAAFTDILRKWSENDRFIINIMYVNRLIDDSTNNHVIGPCASTFPFISEVIEGGNFSIRALNFQKQIWTSISHNSISGVELIREFINKKRNSVNSAALPITFSSGLGAISNSGHDFKIFENEVYSELQAPYLMLDAHVREDAKRNVLVDWDCLVEEFKPGVIEGMFTSYINYLINLSQMSEDILIPEIDLHLIAKTNDTECEYPDSLLHHGFIESVYKFPNNIALISDQAKLTYKQLFLIAQYNVNLLLEAGVTPGSIVPIIMGKSLEQIVAVMSILLLGSVFVPIDINTPKIRLTYILKKTKSKLCITDDLDILDILEPDQKIHSIVMREGIEDLSSHTINFEIISPSSLAYIIFTSGTTGEPKGVMITHKAANNTVMDINSRFSVSEKDVLFGISQLSFDLSIYDIFGTFAAGAALVLPLEQDKHNPKAWQRLIDTYAVTIWNSTPGLYELYLDWLNNLPTFNSNLRLTLLSGDWISIQLLRTSKTVMPANELCSLGGATEASIWSIFYPIDNVESLTAIVPYGKPLSNQCIYILDKSLKLCPSWVVGEIYIGGVGLAAGYFAEEQLTRSAFIIHPQTGERLYKTGDLGKLLPDGNVEILGRIDSQVKVRGFRVEIEEIEHRLSQHPAVKSSIIVFRDNILAAFVVMDPKQSISKQELEEYLYQWLPSYMIPNQFHFIDTVPFTSNGKVDRKMLSNTIGKHTTNNEAQAQGSTHRGFTDQQLMISHIWSDVLQIAINSPDENFFDLGGTSLSAVKILNQIQAKFSINSSLAKLFSSPTIAGMTDVIFQASTAKTNIFLSLNQYVKHRPTIFLIHPIGGLAFCYKDLVARFADYNVIGIQSPGNYEAKGINSLSDLAAFYATKISAFLPVGQDMNIGGWSLGAVLAIELSKILASTHNINYMLLIDPPRSAYLSEEAYPYKEEYYYEFALDLLDGKKELLNRSLNNLNDVFDLLADFQKYRGMFTLEDLSSLTAVYKSHSHWLSTYKINNSVKYAIQRIDIMLARESIGTAKHDNLLKFFCSTIGVNSNLEIMPVSHYEIVVHIANNEVIYG